MRKNTWYLKKVLKYSKTRVIYLIFVLKNIYTKFQVNNIKYMQGIRFSINLCRENLIHFIIPDTLQIAGKMLQVYLIDVTVRQNYRHNLKSPSNFLRIVLHTEKTKYLPSVKLIDRCWGPLLEQNSTTRHRICNF